MFVKFSSHSACSITLYLDGPVFDVALRLSSDFIFMPRERMHSPLDVLLMSLRSVFSCIHVQKGQVILLN